MISAPSVKARSDIAVGMGQSLFAREPARLTTILGSCVAVTLYSLHRRVGMLSHVVLPQSKGSASNPAKYADTAVPHMLSTLKSQGVEPRELTAKFVGGACMFGNGACFGAQAGVEVRLSAAGLAGGEFHGHAKAVKNIQDGLTCLRVE